MSQQPVPRRPDPARACRRRRLGRRLAWTGAVLLVLVGGLVFFLPSILSSFAGRLWFSGSLGSRFDARVHLDDLSLSWTAPQKIEGLSIEGVREGEPDPEEAPLVDVPNVTVRTTLFELLFTEKPLVLDIENATVALRRREDGSFNFTGVFGKRTASRHGESGPSASGPGEESFSSIAEVAERLATAPPEPPALVRKARKPRKRSLPFAWIFDLERDVVIALSGCRIEYEDRLLARRSELTDLHGTVRVGSDELTLEASSALLTRARDAVSEGQLSARVTVSGWQGRPADFRADGDVEISGLDLRPYESLLARVAGIAPPEEPVGLKASVRTVGGMLYGDLETTGEVAALSGAVLELPLDGLSPRAHLSVSLSLDGPKAVALFGERIQRPDGAVLRGRFEGTAVATLPASLETFVHQGPAALDGLEARLEGAVHGAAFRWPIDGGDAIECGTGDDGPALALRTRAHLSAPGHGMDWWRRARVEGQVEVDGEVRYGDVSARSLATDFRAGAWKLEIGGSRVDVNGGTVGVERAFLDLSARPVGYGLDARVVGVEVRPSMVPLLAWVLPCGDTSSRGPVLKGTLAWGTLNLRGRGWSLRNLERTLSGHGRLRLEDGAAGGAELAESLGEQPALADLDLRFHRLDADFEVVRGEVVTHAVLATDEREEGESKVVFQRTLRFGAPARGGAKLAARREAWGTVDANASSRNAGGAGS